MIETRPTWPAWTLLTLTFCVWACACGSGIRPEPTGTTELHGGQPTDVPAQAPTLRGALAAMCDEATRLMSLRDRHASQRLGALNLRMMDSEHRRALEEMGRGMASEPHPIAGEVWRFEDMVVQAEQAGEAGFRCAALERLLELVAAGDEDFDEANAASFEADLRLACQIIAELEARGLHPREERARFSEYVVVSATNPEFFQMLGSVAPAEDKRSVIRAFAEEQGASEWACLADFVERVTN